MGSNQGIGRRTQRPFLAHSHQCAHGMKTPKRMRKKCWQWPQFVRIFLTWRGEIVYSDASGMGADVHRSLQEVRAFSFSKHHARCVSKQEVLCQGLHLTKG
jgi:hypothetical protein